MKKILCILFCLCLCTLNINAMTTEIATYGFGSNDIWNLDYLNMFVDGTINNIAYVTYKPTGKVAFCIEPDILMNPDSNYRIESYNGNNLNELAEIYLAFESLGSPRDLYGATQMLMWEKLGHYLTVDGKNCWDLGAQKIIDQISSLRHVYRPNIGNAESYPINELITLTDNASVLTKGYHIENYSDGLSEVKLENNQVQFKIDDIYPVDKWIKIVPNSEIARNELAAGEIYLATGSQALFSYNGQLNDRYEGVELHFHHDAGDLELTKFDEFDEIILEPTTFEIKAINNSSLKDINLNAENDYFETKDGLISLKGILPPGDYEVQEKMASYQYELNENPIAIHIEKGQQTNLDIYNQLRDIQFNVTKTDDLGTHFINDAHFSLYDISLPQDVSNIPMVHSFQNNDEDEDEIEDIKPYPLSDLFLAKQNHLINLNDVFEQEHQLYLLIDENLKATLVEEPTIFKDKHRYAAYGLDKSLEEFEVPTINDKLTYKDDLTNFDSINWDSEEISDIHLLNKVVSKPQQQIFAYQFKKGDQLFILLKPINFECDDELTEPQVYVFDKAQDLTIINDDDQIFSGDYKHYNGLKIKAEISGQDSIQLIDPLRHNYYLKNTETTLFDENEKQVGLFTSDELGYLNLGDLPNGKYHYFVNDQQIDFEYNPSAGTFSLDHLLQNRQYLLVEDQPAPGYGFADANPVTLLDGHFNAEEVSRNIDQSNDLLNYHFTLLKTNASKELSLNNAIFEIYTMPNANPHIIEKSFENEQESLELLGTYQTGCLNINGEFTDLIIPDHHYQLDITQIMPNENKLDDLSVELVTTKYPVLNVAYQDSLTIENLEKGNYAVQLYDIDLKQNIGEALNFEVVKGGFVVKDVPYNRNLKIIETKAPQGYYKNAEPLIIEPNFDNYQAYLHNYRINQMIIINTSTDV